MSPDVLRFLVAGHRKIIGHYRRLLVSSQAAEEREWLQRKIEDQEQELRSLLQDGGLPRARAA